MLRGKIVYISAGFKTAAGSKVSFTGRIQISLLSTLAQMSFKRKISTPGLVNTARGKSQTEVPDRGPWCPPGHSWAWPPAHSWPAPAGSSQPPVLPAGEEGWLGSKREVKWFPLFIVQWWKLEDTARYAGLLLAPAEGFGRHFFFPSGKKKSLLCCFGPFLAIFGVLVTFSSNISKNTKKSKQIQKNSKNL